ncbi:hypothetical protein JOC86_004071 [Bacillus pakistanensis]|uniref:Uncharacterized protein n=1 Tax=Rossellomorea pakistanensis TaxID=992288 RepID=A0ABS2NI50_9BACI|nr:hypothetical protein [Bacillus pakistanensis]
MGDWNKQAAPNNNLRSAQIRTSNLVSKKEQDPKDKNSKNKES